MLSEGARIKGSDGQSYQLGKQIGTGGEGVVFLIQGGPFVAKLYKQPSEAQEQKLLSMLKTPDLAKLSQTPPLQLGWPNDVLYDMDGNFVGYRMRCIQGGIEIFEIDRCCSSPKAKAMFPDYSWKLNVLVARNLASAVNYLHSMNYVIGDMNCKNILVMQDGSIAILDTDSFAFRDKKNRTRYHCGVGTEDYLAPELQGRNLQDAGAAFNASTDNFALAIHIFQLLMNNYHPFSGRRLTAAKNSLSENPRLEQIGNGICPYINSYPDLDIPVGAPAIDEVLPEYLKKDFIKTFDYNARNALRKARGRTTALVWEQDLNRLLKQFQKKGRFLTCAIHPQYQYLKRIGTCGLCAAEKRLQQLTTPGAQMQQDPQASAAKQATTKKQASAAKQATTKKQASATKQATAKPPTQEGPGLLKWALAIVLCALLLANTGTIYKYYQYHEAMDDYKNGLYSYAIDEFEQLGDFKDSSAMKEQSMAGLYNEAMEYYNGDDYNSAIKRLEQLDDYQDSGILKIYCEAMQSFHQNDYTAAAEAFGTLGGFKDSSSMKDYCTAMALYDAEDYDAAIAQFESLGRFKMSREMKNYCEAMRYYDAEDYGAAMNLFAALEDFKYSENLKDRCMDAYYKEAVHAYNSGDYATATDKFKQLGDYEDSLEMSHKSMAKYVDMEGAHDQQTHDYLMELIGIDSSWQEKYDKLFRWHVSIDCVNKSGTYYIPNTVREFQSGEPVYIHFSVDGGPLNDSCTPTYVTSSAGKEEEKKFSFSFYYGRRGYIYKSGYTEDFEITIYDEDHTEIGSVHLDCID